MTVRWQVAWAAAWCVSMALGTANAEPPKPQGKETAAAKARKVQKAAMVRQIERSLDTVQTKAGELGKLTEVIRSMGGKQAAQAKMRQARNVLAQLRPPLAAIRAKVKQLEPGDMTGEQISAVSFRLVEAKNILRQARTEVAQGQPPSVGDCTQKITATGGCNRQACLSCCSALGGAARNACDFACEAETLWCIADQLMDDVNDRNSSGVGAINHG
jgi:small-conductance mechanosensitive channel